MAERVKRMTAPASPPPRMSAGIHMISRFVSGSSQGWRYWSGGTHPNHSRPYTSARSASQKLGTASRAIAKLRPM